MNHTKTLKLAATITFLKLTSLTTAFAAGQPDLNKLTPRPGSTSTYKDLSTIKNLPTITMESGISNIIKTVLAWSMILTLIALIVTGIFYLTSQGEESGTTKAKNMLKYLLIGILAIASAYGIVSGVASFDFFKAA